MPSINPLFAIAKKRARLNQQLRTLAARIGKENKAAMVELERIADPNAHEQARIELAARAIRGELEGTLCWKAREWTDVSQVEQLETYFNALISRDDTEWPKIDPELETEIRKHFVVIIWRRIHLARTPFPADYFAGQRTEWYAQAIAK